MTDDILNTTQNPHEQHRLAQELLTAQAHEYEQRLHNLNAAMQAEKTHMNSASTSRKMP